MEIVKIISEKYKAKDGALFNDSYSCRMHEKGIPYSKYYTKLNSLTEFNVTGNHLKLVKHSTIDCVFLNDNYNAGHFYQDIKRPYGNSNWIGDIAEILGVDMDCVNPDDEDDKWFSDSLEYYLVCHHIDMRVIVEILCQNLCIQEGVYVRDSIYCGEWKLKKT